MKAFKTMHRKISRANRKQLGQVIIVFVATLIRATYVSAAEVTIALPAKSFQQIIFPLALERGYMKEEGIDIKITFMEPTPSIQALVADSIQLTAAGGSALVAIARGGIPVKVVFAVNDRV
ncbi:MAG: hypothetical protein E6J74_40455, partial [Deltaproteobacteria bacterium]